MKNLRITVNGTAYDVQVEDLGTAAAPEQAAVPAPAAPAPVPAPAAPAPVPASAPVPVPVAPAVSASAPRAAGGETVGSPMPGNIVSTNVKPGQDVKAGQVLVVLEAMKMENEIVAEHDAKVVAVLVNKGDNVESGDPLVTLQ